MRHPIAKTIAAAATVLVLLCGISAAAVPALRHVVSGWWNNPEGLPALPETPEVHYEPGAIEQARTVAATLPAAMARVEAVHGRRFAHPVVIGVYVSPEAFASAKGSGSPGSLGVMFTISGNVTLSPDLFSRQRRRLPAILTHELSHAHLRSWMSALAFMRLPHWFKEGLAVMVSGGGGAEGISEAQARDAIRRGDHIALESSASLLNFDDIEFENPPVIPDSSFRTLMAYRQAGLFVSFLHDSNPAGFERMMDAIFQSRSFADAVTAGYAADLPTLWSRFAQVPAD
jgi:hypothetical protein